jgi:hypothetical protein
MSLHRNIKKYSIDGVVNDDASFLRTRVQFENILIRQMRDEGRVPVLGFGPFWSTEYNEEQENYNFIITAYGVYVGRRRAESLEGVDGSGRWFERS